MPAVPGCLEQRYLAPLFDRGCAHTPVGLHWCSQPTVRTAAYSVDLEDEDLTVRNLISLTLIAVGSRSNPWVTGSWSVPQYTYLLRGGPYCLTSTSVRRLVVR